MGGIRRQNSFEVIWERIYWMEVLVSVSSVPKPNSIKLAVAHVVALDLAHNFSVSSYLSMEVVLMFHARLVEVEEAVKFVVGVMVLHGAKKLVRESAVEDVIEKVIMMVVPDSLAIFETDLFVARLLHVRFCEA